MVPAHFGTMETFAKNLKERAEQLDVPNAEIARRIGVSERRYAHYTRGDREPDLATLVRIAALLRTSTDELLGAIEPVQPTRRGILQEKLLAAIDGLADRDFALFVAMAESAATFSRARARDGD